MHHVAAYPTFSITTVILLINV